MPVLTWTGLVAWLLHFFSDFDELFRDLVEVRDAVKKELARNSKYADVIAEDEEELVVEDYESDNDPDDEKKDRYNIYKTS